MHPSFQKIYDFHNHFDVNTKLFLFMFSVLDLGSSSSCCAWIPFMLCMVFYLCLPGWEVLY